MTSPSHHLVGIAIVSLLSLPTITFADPALDQGLERLSGAVAEVLQQQAEDSISVGDFVATHLPNASGGAGLKKLIADALAKKGIKVSAAAKLQLLGRFAVPLEKNKGESFDSVALKISASIVDRNDQEIAKPNISVFTDDALLFSGASGNIPPTNARPEEREKAKADAIRNPSVAAVGNQTRTDADSPFGIEILVSRGSNQESRPPQVKTVEGAGQMAFVKLAEGEEYIVRLHNQSDEEAAVVLTIDGLNMFTFSKEGTFGGQVLVAKGTHVDIPGWAVNETDSDAFEVSNYAKSAAASLGKPITDVGTISAAFFTTGVASAKTLADDPLATKRGRRIGKKYVLEPREIKDQECVISVRYERGN
jgi:hypothetical protein